MDLPNYLGMFAEQLVNELTPITKVKGVTSNPALLGTYTEAAVRKLVIRMVSPLRVCTGAVLDFPLPEKLSQIDIIIWAPYPAPAIFEVEGFGLVPRSSAFGVLEVKRSNYSEIDDKLEEFTTAVADKKLTSDPGGSVEDYRRPAGLSVVCVLESPLSARLQKMVDAEQAVAIFEQIGGNTNIRPRDVIRLVNFLHYITWRYRVLGSRPGYPQIPIDSLT